MVEDDTFTYQVKQQPRIQQASTAAHSLITKERMQKLDLLIHLLSNLTQALVVCGPVGIGKTTLLNFLQQRKAESWQYCLVQGTADLSFETIHGQLARCIRQHNRDAEIKSLSAAFKHYESQHKQVVLIIDDAGELVPGLISAIIQYAAANPALRVVFALTHDEMQVKRGSDRAVDDCHIIEIPPLSEQQCGDFLQHLSANLQANLSFKAIGENMIAHIYRETHGVPGRIIAEVSGSSGAKSAGKLKWILAFAVAAAVAIAVGAQWMLSTGQFNTVPAAAKEVKNAANLPEAAIQPSASPSLAAEPVAAAVEQNAEAIDLALPQPESAPAQSVAPVQAPSAPVEQVKTVAAPINVNAGQSVAPVAKPEAAGTVDVKALADVPPRPALLNPVGQSITPPVAQEKPAQLEAKGKVNAVVPPAPDSVPSKAKAKSDVEASHKQAEVTAQQLGEPAAGKQEELQPVEPVKTPNAVEPLMPEAAPVAQQPVAVPPEPVQDAAAAQPAEPERFSVTSSNGYTLQLMVLSKQSSAEAILKKYPALSQNFRIIKTHANGGEKFIVTYGSYPDAASANRARQSLPADFANALARKTSSISK